MPNTPTCIQERVNLRTYNTLGVDCQARYFAEVATREELQNVLAWWRQKTLGLLLLGGGSNVVLGAEFNGLALKCALRGRSVESLENGRIALTLAAGENWHDTVMWSLHQGYYGLENLALIPGCVGAAPIQNIGAYGVELKDRFLHLDAIHLETGELRRFSREACEFGYRDSVFKQAFKGQYAIVSVTLCLTQTPELVLAYPALMEAMKSGAAATPLDVAEAVCNVRRSKLPDPIKIGNAGSFFKNPVVSAARAQTLVAQHPKMPAHPVEDGVKIAAGWLIEQAGYKGYQKGQAGVHDKQALVLVNRGHASGQDILALAQELQEAVKQHYGIELDIEPQIYA
ncbi:UDP-N-acetylenolpyruvoylglucosamine reductase [gamma proteobacterium HTCC5015]|nr:UDP-N-acetylenolpyruvoylglucosamine reductase [gamma proteobacterium HTCC5015]